MLDPGQLVPDACRRLRLIITWHGHEKLWLAMLEALCGDPNLNRMAAPAFFMTKTHFQTKILGAIKSSKPPWPASQIVFTGLCED